MKMEKQTRMNKYKKLRDEMMDEVTINHSSFVESENVEDDDFLSFLPKEEKKNMSDTLMEPLTYETLDNDNENIKMALNEAKVNLGKEQYNTRLDILNKIKKDESVSREGTVQTQEVKKETMAKEPEKKMTLLEKLAAMSPEEDAEELRRYEEGLTVSDFMKDQKKQKKIEQSKSQKKPEVKNDIKKSQKNKIKKEEVIEEKESHLVSFLNYVIIVLIIIFLVLAFFIAKQLLM